MRASKTVAALAAFGLLSGCGLAARAQHEEAMKAAQAEQKAAAASCEEQYPKGRRETAVARFKCFTDGARPMRQFSTNPDLFDRFWAHGALVAEQMQAGKLTPAEANAQNADFQSQLVAEEQQRNLANRAVGAQERVAQAANTAAMMQGVAALQAANRPVVSPTVNCTTTGFYQMRQTTCN